MEKEEKFISILVYIEALIFRDHGIADGNAEKPI